MHTHVCVGYDSGGMGHASTVWDAAFRYAYVYMR
jgi:hypothetical protein